MSLTVKDAVCDTGAPPSEDWYLRLRLTGTPFLRPARDLSARVADLLGFITKVTGPAPVTFVTPLPYVIAAGRHLQFSLSWRWRHLERADAKTPNLPLANVARHVHLPGLLTVTFTVMAPVRVL